MRVSPSLSGTLENRCLCVESLLSEQWELASFVVVYSPEWLCSSNTRPTTGQNGRSQYASEELPELSTTVSPASMPACAPFRSHDRAVFGEGEHRETAGYDHVDALTHANRTYQEALRLYPPAWATFRQATAEVRLGDFRIEKGSDIVLPQWSIQRDQRYFENPREFDPDRWKRRSPDSVPAYFPFASGPHSCIGRAFALSGATLALSRLTQESTSTCQPMLWTIYVRLRLYALQRACLQ